ncbi:hypothetical protein [Telmatospirillum sp. J64-1]|uniref:ribosome modulation factor n=1 Tax=Telmatospirillum sp. J64-1 TaxID=2502183 RepID=UPI00115DB9AE|nr:hypothetical protein [Telmatospirillum sp. J64-1]
MTDQDFYQLPLLSYPDLMLNLLKVASRRAAGLDDAVAELNAMLEAAGEQPRASAEEVRERLDTARIYLQEALLLKPVDDGRFCITERGRRILAENPQGVDDTVLMQFREFRDFLNRHHGEDQPEDPGLKEYDEGYAAFLQGLPLTANPHRFESGRHLHWENGWFEARDEHMAGERESGAAADLRASSQIR